VRAARVRPAAVALAFGLVGLAIAAYLTVVRLAGELPACGPVGGCETVALSEYSVIAGIPLALLGLGFSLAIVALTAVWWRTGSRQAHLVVYGLGLFGVLVVAYLSYVELFVIHAICAWCVAYAVTVVGGWLTATVELRRTPG
jgi:uncharacterized membrane protein